MKNPYRKVRRAISRLGLRVPAGVKRYTNPVFGRVPIVIMTGPNRGAMWSLASAGSGYGTGTRERRQLEVLEELVRPGDRVWDVGAHYGYLTLCAARAAGADGSVDAFEPSPGSRFFLERHLRWNRCATVRMHEYAIGAEDGVSRFGGGQSSKTHHLGSGDQIVQVRTIATLLASGECAPPTFLKIDIEGAEADLLENGLDAIAANARIILAVHSQEQYERCRAALEKRRYGMYESRRLRDRKANGWRSDADLIAFGPDDDGSARALAWLAGLDY